MKKIIPILIGALITLSCASPQKTKFANESFSQMLVTTNNSEIRFF